VAGRQREAAARTAVGPHRHAGVEQRIDVPVHRARRDAQPRGQVGRGEPPAELEEQQQGDQPAGAHAVR
jgi:hypothetical protein